MKKEILSPRRSKLWQPPCASLFLLPRYGVYMKKKKTSREGSRKMEVAYFKAVESLVELGSSSRHLKPSACQKLSSYLQHCVCPCKHIRFGNHRECWHFFQCSICTSPVNASRFLSRSVFLPGAGGVSPIRFGKGRKRWGNMISN